tara:strand:+ start:987 stop:1430 length:444 start_codon:yes stop_codon:yes gene_type:complete
MTMTTTDVPFRATMNIDIAGQRVLLTAGGDTIFEFNSRWAELAEEASTLIESFNLLAAAATVAPIAAGSSAPGAEPVAAPSPWGTPAPAPVQAAPVPAANAPMCDHGQPMKLVPAGVSKKTGKPYPGFYACNNPSRDSQCSKTYPAS